MEEKTSYTVKLTPEAESYYFDVLEYFYNHHSESIADKKSKELLDKTIALENNPLIGRREENLSVLGHDHRYILYYYTKIKAIKIIYIVNEYSKVVYITDFFPCESNEIRISSR